MTELEAQFRDHLRQALVEPGLEFAERPTPITGGFDTRIFAFRLTGVPPAFAGPLILRLLDGHSDPSRVLRERAIQNALVELGYPAPRVLLASAEATPLGGAFLIMDRLAGKPLPEVHFLGMGQVVAELQARLHGLDAESFLENLARDSLVPRSLTFEGHLEQLADRVARRSLTGLARGIDWLVQQCPRLDGRRVICHGDFHPYNILMAAGAVTGVIDWPNAIVADPAFDVAATLVILKLVPVDLSGLRAPLTWLAAAARPLLVAGYLRRYRRRRELDLARLSYYEAAACMKALVRAGELRLSPGGASAPNPLFASDYPDRLVHRFQGITGVTPVLPTAPIAAPALASPKG